jgi:squalene-hopene/tetraprenyl-beta-curcumene cyclase
MFISRIALSFVGVCILIALALPSATSAQDKSNPYQPSQAPLDKRVKPDRITEIDLPPLPERVVMPKPPEHAISTNPAEVPINSESWMKAQDSIMKGLEFLRSKQDSRGGWMKDAKAAPTDQPDRPSSVTLAVTAMALKAFIQANPNALKTSEPDQNVAMALKLIASAHKPDGTFDDGSLANYVNSSILSALATIGDRDQHDAIVDLQKVLVSNQWDQSEGLSPRQDWFGGAGYGNEGRPDLSNTQMMLDALYDSGMSPEEPVFQKAVAFLSRTQNLKETNKADWAGNDGGFIYSPANGGESKASQAAGEGIYGEKLVAAGQPRSLRSYGSMTYAGFKSMLYAGLSPDDVRVRAAFDWIRHHWTFEENPGLAQQGLYYYYNTIARALNIAQQNEITDVNGKKHNWREELIAAVVTRQKPDGSWSNEADRWMEGSPELVTCYCVLALEEALKPVNAVSAPTSSK